MLSNMEFNHERLVESLETSLEKERNHAKDLEDQLQTVKSKPIVPAVAATSVHSSTTNVEMEDKLRRLEYSYKVKCLELDSVMKTMSSAAGFPSDADRHVEKSSKKSSNSNSNSINALNVSQTRRELSNMHEILRNYPDSDKDGFGSGSDDISSSENSSSSSSSSFGMLPEVPTGNTAAATAVTTSNFSTIGLTRAPPLPDETILFSPGNGIVIGGGGGGGGGCGGRDLPDALRSGIALKLTIGSVRVNTS